MVLFFRVISRVVLIPFREDDDHGDALAPSTREVVDRHLKQCMKEGYKAAGVMVALGNTLCGDNAQLHDVMDRIALILEGALQRIYVSYAWLMLASLKVGLAASISDSKVNSYCEVHCCSCGLAASISDSKVNSYSEVQCCSCGLHASISDSKVNSYCEVQCCSCGLDADSKVNSYCEVHCCSCGLAASISDSKVNSYCEVQTVRCCLWWFLV